MADGTMVLNQTWQGQVNQNVLVWSNIPTDAQGRQDMADSMRDTWVTHIGQTGRHQDWSLDNVTFIYNDSLPIFSVDVEFTLGAFTGNTTGDPLPAQIALLVSTQIIAAPPNRGRVYLSGYDEGAIAADGRFTSLAVNNAQDLVESWRDGLSYTGGAGVAFLRIARRDLTGVITTSNAVETVVPKGIPATQRRRRQAVGI